MVSLRVDRGKGGGDEKLPILAIRPLRREIDFVAPGKAAEPTYAAATLVPLS